MRSTVTDIVADLIRVHEMLTSRPFPQALWFIDRDRQYFRLERASPLIEQSPYRIFESSVFGIPVYRWASREIRLRITELIEDERWDIDRVRRVFPFCQPGIWVQMSSGRHQHFEIISPTIPGPSATVEQCALVDAKVEYTTEAE
jgi:hypothetical protein